MRNHFNQSQNRQQRNRHRGPRHQRLRAESNVQHIRGGRQSGPIKNKKPQLLRKGRIQFPHLNRKPTHPSKGLQVPMHSKHKPIRPSSRQRAMQALRFVKPRSIRAVKQSNQRKEPKAIRGPPRHVSKLPSNQAYKRKPSRRPTVPTQAAHTVTTHTARPQQRRHRAQLNISPSQDGPQLRSQRVQPQPATRRRQQQRTRPCNRP